MDGAQALQYQPMHNNNNWQVLEFQYQTFLPEVMPMIYVQSTCQSPFMGEYIASLSPQHRWITVTLRGKALMKDFESQTVNYPIWTPKIFQRAPQEDYYPDVCAAICKWNHLYSVS